MRDRHINLVVKKHIRKEIYRYLRKLEAINIQKSNTQYDATFLKENMPQDNKLEELIFPILSLFWNHRIISGGLPTQITQNSLKLFIHAMVVGFGEDKVFKVNSTEITLPTYTEDRWVYVYIDEDGEFIINKYEPIVGDNTERISICKIWIEHDATSLNLSLLRDLRPVGIASANLNHVLRQAFTNLMQAVPSLLDSCMTIIPHDESDDLLYIYIQANNNNGFFALYTPFPEEEVIIPKPELGTKDYIVLARAFMDNFSADDLLFKYIVIEKGQSISNNDIPLCLIKNITSTTESITENMIETFGYQKMKEDYYSYYFIFNDRKINASEIGFDPESGSSLESDNVQDALNELAEEKSDINHTHIIRGLEDYGEESGHPENGDVLTWDDIEQKYMPKAPSGGPGSVDWGDIGGTLADQIDLIGALDGKSDVDHIHDDRYYTETEIDNLLNGKANTLHQHPIADIEEYAEDSGRPQDGDILTWNDGEGKYKPLPPSVGGGSWGAITGNIETQTDLIAYFNKDRYNIALLGFRLAATNSLTLGLMIDGFIDEYENETGIDVVNSINETYNSIHNSYDTWNFPSGMVLLIHANGADGETTFVDFSGKEHTITNPGVILAEKDTAIKKFGSASALFSTVNNCYLEIASHSDFIWDGEFTMECWAYLSYTPTSSYDFIMGNDIKYNVANSLGVHVDTAGKVVVYVNTAIRITSTTAVNNSTWHHIAVVRDSSNNIKLYINGTNEGNTYNYTSILNSGCAMRFGMNAADPLTRFGGQLDEMVFYNTCIYTANFSPPIAEYVETVNDITLISENQIAETVPNYARLIFLIEDIDSATINIDIKAYVSRNDGSDYIQVTLIDEGDYSSGIKILSGIVNISEQPSDTDIVYKITTHNTKKIRIHGTALFWD